MDYQEIASKWSGMICFDGLGNITVLKASDHYFFDNVVASDYHRYEVDLFNLSVYNNEGCDAYFEDVLSTPREQWFIKY